MPGPRSSMHKIRELLRLQALGLSQREIGRCTGLSNGVVAKYQKLARKAGLAWPLPDDFDDDALERRLYGQAPQASKPHRFAEPDFPSIHQQLKRKGVTLTLLFEEYRLEHPDDGYQFTAFCVRFRRWQASLKRSMRQTHRAGEKLFVDYAGQTVPVFDGAVLRLAQIFVAVLGASNYTYAEATFSQQMPDWIGAHTRALEFFGGATELAVPDNLRAAVTRAHRFEPDVNRTYEDFARHYGMAVLPARPYKPRDKAKVEVGVQVVERWILARLRHAQFHSLSDLNAHIRELLVELNERPFRKLPGCRRSLFEAIDQPALRPLPSNRFEYHVWKKATVGIDYHVEVGGHYYSVPHALVRKLVDVRVTGTVVEVFHRHRRVASHVRSTARGGQSTHAEHMPAAHRAHREWTPASLLMWAALVGPDTAEVVRHTLETKPHPEQGYRSCLGLRSLSKTYGEDRLEAACRRARLIGGVSLASIESILKLGVDRLPLPDDEQSRDHDFVHENVRGPEYYRDGEDEEERPC
jgi:transposase